MPENRKAVKALIEHHQRLAVENAALRAEAERLTENAAVAQRARCCAWHAEEATGVGTWWMGRSPDLMLGQWWPPEMGLQFTESMHSSLSM